MIDKSRPNRKKLRKFEGFKFKVDDKDFEAKFTEVLEKFNKTELVQIANFLQTEINETKKEIAHNILSVLMDLDTFSSSFESYSDTENPDLSQNTQQTDEDSLNTTSKQNKSEFFPQVHD